MPYLDYQEQKTAIIHILDIAPKVKVTIPQNYAVLPTKLKRKDLVLSKKSPITGNDGSSSRAKRQISLGKGKSPYRNNFSPKHTGVLPVFFSLGVNQEINMDLEERITSKKLRLKFDNYIRELKQNHSGDSKQFFEFKYDAVHQLFSILVRDKFTLSNEFQGLETQRNYTHLVQEKIADMIYFLYGEFLGKPRTNLILEGVVITEPVGNCLGHELFMAMNTVNVNETEFDDPDPDYGD